eukprot:jgi/Tetstr1/443204/TSEL_031244.t1
MSEQPKGVRADRLRKVAARPVAPGGTSDYYARGNNTPLGSPEACGEPGCNSDPDDFGYLAGANMLHPASERAFCDT